MGNSLNSAASEANSTDIDVRSYATSTRFPPCQSGPDELQELLENSSAVASVEEIFADGKLPCDHGFSWQTVSANPKGDHGEISIRGTWYKTMNYHLCHTGGFLRLCTMRGRGYWNAQNETSHTSPDWKLHFSCELTDIPLAWNVLAALFMEMKCEIGMKATYLDARQWGESQRGREVTVYIYKWHYSYNGYMQGVVDGRDHDFFMDQSLSEIYSCPFWFNFIRTAERRLAHEGVRSRGVADGDLQLPGCVYTSLRNESFVKDPAKCETDTDKVYPPNSCGWNAAGHPNPFVDVIFFLKQLEPFMHALHRLSGDSHDRSTR